MIFTPQTDLAILSFIAHHIISTGRVRKGFVAKHVNFALGNADIGYGLRPEDEREKREERRRCRSDEGDLARRIRQVRFSMASTAYRSFRASARLLAELAELYADPKRKVVSLWTMGFNQHTRGTWVNQLCHNVRR